MVPPEFLQVLLILLPDRLALSHNQLQTFPARFSECTSLRYLNVRQNKIKEFPLPVSFLGSFSGVDQSAYRNGG